MADISEILTFDQQQGIKPISKNNASKFSQLLNETINTDLVQLLGAAFVTALKKEPTVARFVNILDSNTYENCYGNDVTFEGLRYVIAYLLHSRYIRSSSSHDTFSGVVKVNRPESENVSDGTLRAMQQESKDIAVTQFNLVKSYLVENCADYPEFEYANASKTFTPRMINIRKTER